MEYGELVERIYTLYSKANEISGKLRETLSKAYRMRSELEEDIKKLFTMSIKGKKKIIQLSHDSYLKITKKTVWICYKSAWGEKNYCTRRDWKVDAAIRDVIENEELVSQFDHGELIRRAHILAKKLRGFERKYDRYDAQIFIGDVDCPICSIGEEIRCGTIKDVFLRPGQSNCFEIIVSSNSMKYASLYDKDVLMGIAYNCYEEFLAILGKAEQIVDRIKSELEKLEEEYKQIKAEIEILSSIA